jgi:putative transposase
MPWKDTRPVDQRLKFIEARLSGEHSMVTLCRMFGISTKTGYKWWHRFEQEHSEFKGPVCAASNAT